MGLKVNIKETHLSTKITLSFLIVIIASVSCIWFVAYNQSYRLLVNSLSEKSIQIAEAAEKQIDTEVFVNLNTAEDEQNEDYLSMRESLQELRVLTGAKYLYTMKKNDQGEYIYVIDGSDEEDFSHIGDVEETELAYDIVYEGKPYISERIELNEWGTLLCSYYPLKNKQNDVIGFIGIDYDAEREYLAFQQYKWNLMIMVLLLMIIASLIGLLLSKRIVLPIKNLTKLMKKVEQGDLTVQAEITSSDEIGYLSRNFNRMIEHIKNLTGKVYESSSTINVSSEELSSSVEKISVQTHFVNKHVNEIALAMEETSASIQEIACSSSNITEEVRQLLTQAQKSNQVVKEIKARAGSMQEDAKESNNVTQKMYKDIKEKMLQAAKQGEVVQQIKGMSELIASIAKQTNLLSINASIEAARAGELGKGFGVVAEQVRTLASQSADTVENIDQLVFHIQEAFNNLFIILEDMLNFIESKIINDYERLEASGTSYLEDADTVENLVKSFVSHSKEVLEIVDKVSASVEEVATTIEETSTSLQDISGNVNDTTESMQNIQSIAQGQTSIAKELNITVGKLFKKGDRA